MLLAARHRVAGPLATFALLAALLPHAAFADFSGVSYAYDNHNAGRQTGMAQTRYDIAIASMGTNPYCEVDFFSHPKVWQTQYLTFSAGGSYDAIEFATLHEKCSDGKEHRWWVASYVDGSGTQLTVYSVNNISVANHVFYISKSGSYDWTYTIDATNIASVTLSGNAGAGVLATMGLESYDSAASTGGFQPISQMRTIQDGCCYVGWVPDGGWNAVPNPPMDGYYSTNSTGDVREN